MQGIRSQLAAARMKVAGGVTITALGALATAALSATPARTSAATNTTARPVADVQTRVERRTVRLPARRTVVTRDIAAPAAPGVARSAAAAPTVAAEPRRKTRRKKRVRRGNAQAHRVHRKRRQTKRHKARRPSRVA